MKNDISVAEATERALPVSDKYLLLTKDALLEQFDKIMKEN
jgi:hypothetical protein